MNVNAFNAVKAYGSAQQALRPELKNPVTDSGTDSGFHPEKMIKAVTDTIVTSESTASAFMVGKADPHSVVEALAAAELAVETAVTLRNRVVEAYQELLRMPV